MTTERPVEYLVYCPISGPQIRAFPFKSVFAVG